MAEKKKTEIKVLSYEDYKNGETPQSIAQIKLEFIREFCLDNLEAAKWFCQNCTGMKFMNVRSLFCEKFLGLKSKTTNSSLTMEDVAKELKTKYKLK